MEFIYHYFFLVDGKWPELGAMLFPTASWRVHSSCKMAKEMCPQKKVSARVNSRHMDVKCASQCLLLSDPPIHWLLWHQSKCSAPAAIVGQLQVPQATQGWVLLLSLSMSQG